MAGHEHYGALLSERTLQQHAGRVQLPTYDRRALLPGVFHFGVGGFHRAHQAAYFEDLACAGNRSWGVVGATLRSRDMKQGLVPQDCLYTVVSRCADAERARVIGVMKGCMFGPERPAAVVAALSDPQTRLVTLTVTGDAYREDAQVSGTGARSTVFEYLVEALAHRRRTGSAPFTVLSCDNVPDNGSAARDAVLRVARGRDEMLARWIDHRVSFPSSVVDRITPEPTAETRRFVNAEFGINDRRPVTAEPFGQWVIEDDFCNERPPLDEVGVEFVQDARPYELAKKRLLNAGHSAIGYLGALAGYERIDEAMRDPLLRSYLEQLLRVEIAPLLPRTAGIDLQAYVSSLLERFANPRIGDRLERLCGRGSTKMPAYLLPSLEEAVAQGKPHRLLTMAVAAWFRYIRGVTDDGLPLPVKDARLAELEPLVRGGDPRAFLARIGVLDGNERFATSLARAIRDLDQNGVLGAQRRDGAPSVIAA